jgi:hypothetical protein
VLEDIFDSASLRETAIIVDLIGTSLTAALIELSPMRNAHSLLDDFI